jgi:hypothetical protein
MHRSRVEALKAEGLQMLGKQSKILLQLILRL